MPCFRFVFLIGSAHSFCLASESPPPPVLVTHVRATRLAFVYLLSYFITFFFPLLPEVHLRLLPGGRFCNTHIHTHTHTQHISPWEDQCEWHKMTRMTGPDCAVMRNLINTHIHIHTHSGDRNGNESGEEREGGRRLWYRPHK